MSAVCSWNYCIKGTERSRPPRAAYINLYNWTDSEIMKSAIPRDGVSCRQMYLRSYQFSTKESTTEKTSKCVAKVKEKLGRRKRNRNRNRKCLILIWRKMKKFSCNLVMFGSFPRILSCAASVDVVDQNNGNRC